MIFEALLYEATISLYELFEILLLTIKHFLYNSKKSFLELDEVVASIISFLIFLSFNKFLNLSFKKIKISCATETFVNLIFCSLYKTIEYPIKSFNLIVNLFSIIILNIPIAVLLNANGSFELGGFSLIPKKPTNVSILSKRATAEPSFFF